LTRRLVLLRAIPLGAAGTFGPGNAPFRWSAWAAPKTADGRFDHDNALTGDDLIMFVNNKLFPYLKGFKQGAADTDTIEYKIGEIFGDIPNKFQSGCSLRDALELVGKLS